MDFFNKVLKRTSIVNTVNYLLYGVECGIDETRDYETRLDNAYLECERDYSKNKENKDFDFLSTVEIFASEISTVYTEIGFQAGILMMNDIIHNAQLSINEKESSKIHNILLKGINGALYILKFTGSVENAIQILENTKHSVKDNI